MRYVALLRGIAPTNPNHRNEKLRGVLESLGLAQVTSVITSGNVVFDADPGTAAELEAMIEAAWPERLGISIGTIVRTQHDLEHLVAADPYAGRDIAQTAGWNVTFLKRAPAVPVPLPYRAEAGDYEIITEVDQAVCSAIDPESDRAPGGLMRWLDHRPGCKPPAQTPTRVAKPPTKTGLRNRQLSKSGRPTKPFGPYVDTTSTTPAM